jgi:sensor histidine kinase YesM
MGELIPIVAIVMGMLTVLIPITGFTARFALKPIAEAVARMKEAQGSGQHVALLEQRVALLEQQQANTEDELQKVLEVQQFQEKLLSSADKDS